MSTVEFLLTILQPIVVILVALCGRKAIQAFVKEHFRTLIFKMLGVVLLIALNYGILYYDWYQYETVLKHWPEFFKVYGIALLAGVDAYFSCQIIGSLFD